MQCSRCDQDSSPIVQSKLWCTYHDRVEENLDITLKNLGVDHVDLYLIHWPFRMNANGNDPMFPKKEDGSRDIIADHSVEKDTWKGMEAVYKNGKAKGTISSCSCLVQSS